jgi:hypothetical protein
MHFRCLFVVRYGTFTKCRQTHSQLHRRISAPHHFPLMTPPDSPFVRMHLIEAQSIRTISQANTVDLKNLSAQVMMANLGQHSERRDSPPPHNENLLSVDSTKQTALLLIHVATIASNEVNHRVLQKPRLFRADDPSLVYENTFLSSSSSKPPEPTTRCKCRNCSRQPYSTIPSDDDSHMTPVLSPDVQDAGNSNSLFTPTAISDLTSARTMSTVYKMPNKV